MSGWLCSATKERKKGQTVTSGDIRQNVPFLPASLFCKPPASFDSSGGFWVCVPVCECEGEREHSSSYDTRVKYVLKATTLEIKLIKQT